MQHHSIRRRENPLCAARTLSDFNLVIVSDGFAAEMLEVTRTFVHVWTRVPGQKNQTPGLARTGAARLDESTLRRRCTVRIGQLGFAPQRATRRQAEAAVTLPEWCAERSEVQFRNQCPRSDDVG